MKIQNWIDIFNFTVLKNLTLTFQPALKSQVGFHKVNIILKDINKYPLMSLYSFNVAITDPTAAKNITVVTPSINASLSNDTGLNTTDLTPLKALIISISNAG